MQGQIALIVCFDVLVFHGLWIVITWRLCFQNINTLEEHTHKNRLALQDCTNRLATLKKNGEQEAIQ